MRMRPLRLQGVPLHPFFVHFPVAAWMAATGLALLVIVHPSPEMALAARYVNLFGVVTGLAAMLFGALELVAPPDDPAVRDAIALHATFAFASWSFYLLMWLLQLKGMNLAAALTGIAGLVCLVIAGHLGARIVYHHDFPRGFPASAVRPSGVRGEE